MSNWFKCGNVARVTYFAGLVNILVKRFGEQISFLGIHIFLINTTCCLGIMMPLISVILILSESTFQQVAITIHILWLLFY